MSLLSYHGSGRLEPLQNSNAYLLIFISFSHFYYYYQPNQETPSRIVQLVWTSLLELQSLNTWPYDQKWGLNCSPIYSYSYKTHFSSTMSYLLLSNLKLVLPYRYLNLSKSYHTAKFIKLFQNKKFELFYIK